MKINMSHGSGGKVSSELIDQVFAKYFSNKVLNKMEDAAVLSVKDVDRIAYTTDSFVVTPLVFKGGNIGKLAVCGTVNDLAMMGARPKYLTCGFILEEGLEITLLEEVVKTMAESAKEAGVIIVAGDTKVVEGNGGMFINTSGIGIFEHDKKVSIQGAKPGDVVILSGTLGNHHACILAHRMNIQNGISSDCAPLCGMVKGLFDEKIPVHVMRDVTRGGLGTVLNEVAASSKVSILLKEDTLPVDPEVDGFCDLLGLDPFYMANEGKMICIVPGKQGQKTLEILRKSPYGKNAAIIGEILEPTGHPVTLTTKFGGKRTIDYLYGEGLPRIC